MEMSDAYRLEAALLERLKEGVVDVQILNEGIDRIYGIRILLEDGAIINIIPKSVPEVIEYDGPVESYLSVEEV